MKLKVSSAIVAVLASTSGFGENAYSSEKGSAAGEPSDALHFSSSLGAGLAHDFLGVKLELRYKHVAGFVSKSVVFHLFSMGGGARYYFQPDGHGFFFPSTRR